MQEWISNHIVDATLHPALKLITTARDKSHSNLLITRNYESNSFVRQEKAMYRLVEGSRPFDDQDSSRLAEIALFGSEVYKQPTYSDLMAPEIVKNEYLDASNTSVPEINDLINDSKQHSLRSVKNHSSRL